MHDSIVKFRTLLIIHSHNLQDKGDQEVEKPNFGREIF